MFRHCAVFYSSPLINTVRPDAGSSCFCHLEEKPKTELNVLIPPFLPLLPGAKSQS